MVCERAGQELVHGAGEVILSAGVLGSPHLLQLSGIGEPEALTKAGVPVVHALPGVGKNLQDHLDVILSWECPQPITAYTFNKGINRLITGLNYLLRGQGPGRQNFLESGAFLKSRPDLDRPDLQLHCLLAIMQEHGKVVPTWNYAVVHARGTLQVRDDAAWILQQMKELTAQQESAMSHPWRVEDAPADYTERLLAAVVGIEIPMVTLTGKWKVSQNQPPANQATVVQSLQQFASTHATNDAAAMAALVSSKI